MRPAQRPKNSVISSRVVACTIPATGVRPPFFTFVAVRAIAPVAGIPPNRGDAMFATPWATSSMLERWRPPIIPSATTAESNDSIAPSSAIVNAGAASELMMAIERWGMVGRARPAWISPNRAPIVSTGRCSSWASAVVTISATNGPGMRAEILGHTRMIANAATATTSAHGFTVSKAWTYASHLGRNAEGTDCISRPSRSRIWLEKMISAMPLVNPIVTGNGMNLIAPPRRSSPKAIRMKPAMSVATTSPSTPYLSTIPETITTNAPVGPPICTREPPSSEIRKVFTASALADMVARGEVKLDDPVANYLPRAVRMPVRVRPITLLDLATQSSGLPRLPDNFAPRDSSNPYADYSVQQLYEFLSRYQLPRDPGASYEYSNLGVGLLGHALALRAGMSYEQLVTRRILTHLGMRETAITLTPAMRARLAPGHDVGGNVVPNWDLPTLAGAGALRSTARDMLTFLAANLDTSATPMARGLRQTHEPRQATDNPNLKVGL